MGIFLEELKNKSDSEQLTKELMTFENYTAKLSRKLIS